MTLIPMIDVMDKQLRLCSGACACAGREWPCSRQYATGMINMDNSRAVTMPPIIGAAMRCKTSEPRNCR